MVHKLSGGLTEDGNYSKIRIGLLLLGAVFLGFLTWLIVLSVKINNFDTHSNTGIDLKLESKQRKY